MTLSAQDVWSTYRKSVGSTNHDGSYTLPEQASELGDRQHAGWQAVANLANQHESDSAVSVRKSLNDELKKLRQKNYDLRTRIAGLESDATRSP